MNNKVYLITCSSYKEIDKKVVDLLGMMGGIEEFVSPGENLILKPNLLIGAEPEKAITTHPALVSVVGKLVREQKANPKLIDSSSGAFNHNERSLKRIYQKCGMYQAAQESGITLSYDPSYKAVSYPEGTLIKHFDILTPLLEADGIINLCKFKTHAFMAMTGAVKNMFGAIPGRKKPGFHGKLPDHKFFAQMLLDLVACTAPRLSIMDAVVGMEGDGPGNGTPRHIGLLLASENPLALDMIAGEIMGLNPENNPILVEAKKLGMPPHCLEDIELIGGSKENLRIPDFILPATIVSDDGPRSSNSILRLFQPLLKKSFSLRPQVVKERCIACEHCYEICPMQVISMQENGKKYAEIDDSDCIRCYCCHETCPQDAIELRKGLLYRILDLV